MENYQEITSGEDFTHDFSAWLICKHAYLS
jgi:hypothetical protein